MFFLSHQPCWEEKRLALGLGQEWAATRLSGHGPWPSSWTREPRCPPVLWASWAACCGSLTDETPPILAGVWASAPGLFGREGCGPFGVLKYGPRGGALGD